MAITLLTMAASSFASDTNSENIRFGKSALSLGGAVIGQIDDPEASYYNPAGLGFLDGTHISGSFLWYSFDYRKLHDGLRFRNQAGPTRDLSNWTIFVMPSSAVLTRSFGEDNHIVAFSTFLKTDSEILEKSQDRYSSLSQHAYFITWTQTDRSFIAGPSYALRITNQLSFGVSIFLLAREQYHDFRKSQSEHSASNLRTRYFSDYSSRTNVFDLAVQSRFGLMVKQKRYRSFGINIIPEASSFYGNGTLSSFAIASEGVNSNQQIYQSLVRKQLQAQSRYPFAIAMGYSDRYLDHQYALSATLYFPVEYQRFPLNDQLIENETIQYTNRIEKEMTLQLAMGMQFNHIIHWPMHFGLFSNLSSAPKIPKNPQHSMLERIHMVGFSVSAGHTYLGETINMGLEFQFGRGKSTIFTGSATDREYTTIRRDKVQVILFFSGAIEFAQKNSKTMLEDLKDKSEGTIKLFKEQGALSLEAMQPPAQIANKKHSNNNQQDSRNNSRKNTQKQDSKKNDKIDSNNPKERNLRTNTEGDETDDKSRGIIHSWQHFFDLFN